MPTYAGIGSRRTPEHILTVMGALGVVLGLQGWTLRTGGAPGADQAFQGGAARANGPIELFLPWGTFEEDALAPILTAETWIWRDPSPVALEMASKHHPAWPRLKQGAQKLMARNCHQILGGELNSRVDLVVCYTPDGSLNGQGPDTGGTGMALRVAWAHGKPLVINLAIENHLNYILGILV